MDQGCFRRIKASSARSFINTNVCLIGRIETFNEQKIVIECGDVKINVSGNNINLNDLRLNEFIEVRGEPISENLFLLKDFNKVSSDFNLTTYNKSLELLAPSIDDYK